MSSVVERESAQLKRYIQIRREIVEAFLLNQLPSSTGPGKPLTEAMSYSVQAGGKRIRPIMATVAADFVSNRSGWDETVHAWWREGSPEAEAVLLFGTALEFIHTYSLIHDDLPCMDNDELRRGKPTCHVVYGEATALLAGDALNTDAFLILSRVAPEFRSRAMQAAGVLAQAAGSGGMVIGQMADLEATGKPDRKLNSHISETQLLPEELLLYIHKHKTAALIRASLEGGGILAGANDADLAILSTVGEKVGLLFQVVDDILDIISDTQTLGKTAGRDRDLEKLTYPALLGLDRAREYVGILTQETLACLESSGSRAELLCAIIRYIAGRTS